MVNISSLVYKETATPKRHIAQFTLNIANYGGALNYTFSVLGSAETSENVKPSSICVDNLLNITAAAFVSITLNGIKAQVKPGTRLTFPIEGDVNSFDIDVDATATNNIIIYAIEKGITIPNQT